MTNSGWIFMVCSVGSVVALISWCFLKVLSMPSATEHMHSPIDIDTKDLNT